MSVFTSWGRPARPQTQAAPRGRRAPKCHLSRLGVGRGLQQDGLAGLVAVCLLHLHAARGMGGHPPERREGWGNDGAAAAGSATEPPGTSAVH